MNENNPVSNNDANQTHTLQLSQEDLSQLANVGNGNMTFGPVTISWNFTLSPLEFNANATMMGRNIGQANLNAQHPTAVIGSSFSGFGTQIELSLNQAAMVVNYHVVVKSPFGTIIDKAGNIPL